MKSIIAIVRRIDINYGDRRLMRLQAYPHRTAWGPHVYGEMPVNSMYEAESLYKSL